MTISRELFLAILSMDSYNRGYGAGVELPATAVSIGRATIGESAETLLTKGAAEAAGFYAIAYDMTGVSGFAAGERVISYRGS
jgi:hypothetical protein